MAETIGAFIITAVVSAEAAAATIAGTTITYSAVVGTAALTAASIGLQLAFASSGNLPKPENGHESIRQAIPPPIYGFGTNRIAGAFSFYEISEEGHSLDIKGVHDGYVCGFTEVFWLDEDRVAYETPGGFFIAGQEDGRYGGQNIGVSYRLGEDTEVAYSTAITFFPEIWTAAHRGDFTASILLFCRDVGEGDFTKVYPGGLPDLSAEIKCQGCFDPRLPWHSFATPGTFATNYSENPAQQLLTFLCKSRGGMGLDYATITGSTLDQWIQAIEDCDLPQERAADDPEARYTAHTIYTSETENNAVIQTLLTACDGWLGESGDGSLSFFVGKYREPDLTITDEELREFTINYDVSDDEAVNELQVSFTWPEAEYKQVDVSAWQDAADIEERGVRIAQPFYPQAVHSWTQARRLSKRNMAKLRAEMRGTLSLTLAGHKFYKRRWLKVQSNAHPDLAELVIEVRKRQIDLENARIMIEYISVDPATIDAWNPETEEGDPPELPDDAAPVLIPVPENMAAVVVASGSGNPDRIQVSFDDPELSNALGFSLRWRLADAGGSWNVVNYDYDDADISGGRVKLDLITTIPTDALVEIQAAIMMGRARGEWSASVFIANVAPSLDYSIPQNSGYWFLLMW